MIWLPLTAHVQSHTLSVKHAKWEMHDPCSPPPTHTLNHASAGQYCEQENMETKYRQKTAQVFKLYIIVHIPPT